VNADPKNFAYNIALGKALWADERLSQATQQFDGAELVANTDRQLAEVYFNRARVHEQAGNLTKAQEDWELLLALPADQVPEFWRVYGQEQLALIIPGTPTEGTPEPGTITPTVTAGTGKTATPTPTPKK
jgi:tetratricopeptide (TPR) repeat protein